MDLLEDLRMSLSNFNLLMIYIIHKMLASLKNHLNDLKDNIFEYFKEFDRILFIMESLCLEEKKKIY